MPSKINEPSNSPFQSTRPVQRFQFGMGTLLMAMSLFAVMSTALVFASQLPLVTNEIHAWMGTVPSKNMDGSDRFTQLLFLLFCYSAPLLMVAFLNLISLAANKWFAGNRTTSTDQDKQWEME